MEFIETSGFSKIRENYFDDSQFNMLQLYLMDRPDAGNIIKGSGGIRKLRWRQSDLLLDHERQSNFVSNRVCEE